MVSSQKIWPNQLIPNATPVFSAPPLLSCRSRPAPLVPRCRRAVRPAWRIAGAWLQAHGLWLSSWNPSCRHLRPSSRSLDLIPLQAIPTTSNTSPLSNQRHDIFFPLFCFCHHLSASYHLSPLAPQLILSLNSSRTIGCSSSLMGHAQHVSLNIVDMCSRRIVRLRQCGQQVRCRAGGEGMRLASREESGTKRDEERSCFGDKWVPQNVM